jgi:GDP-mannose 6-dehydrogenase
MRVTVFGLGYVGTVSSACLASLGHEVLGVDVHQAKVDQINAGSSPIVEAQLDELIKEAVAQRRLRATTDGAEAIAWADASLICVGTPSRSNGSLDTGYVEQVIREIGEALKNKSERHTVIVRSTLLPGTTLDVLMPILEEASGKKVGPEIGLAYNPEFLRESTAVKDFWEPPFTVVGGIDEKSLEVASSIYEKIEAPMNRVQIPEAEMIKYACNVFHALKITFANEIGNFAKEHGVDGHVVMNMVCQDRKLNLSPYYMKPGYAYGGSCLPKDLRAVLFSAKRNDLRLPMLESLGESNHIQTQRGIDMVLGYRKRNVSVLGFSFKAGTDDLRESPVVDLIESCLGKGCNLKLYDKNVSWAKLMGANKSYIEAVIPHVSSLMTDSLDEAIAHGDIIVVGNGSEEFAPALEALKDSEKVVIDLVRLKGLSPDWIEAMGHRYQGICW